MQPTQRWNRFSLHPQPSARCLGLPGIASQSKSGPETRSDDQSSVSSAKEVADSNRTLVCGCSHNSLNSFTPRNESPTRLLAESRRSTPHDAAELLRQRIHGVVIWDDEDGVGSGGVPERGRSVTRTGFVHRVLQRRAVALLARVRQPDRVRTSTTRPKISTWTVRAN